MAGMSCDICELVFCRCPDVQNQRDMRAERNMRAEDVSIFDLVRADLTARDEKGWETYGRVMTAHDGRDSLRDAYEEALDLAMYLRKMLRERDGR